MWMLTGRTVVVPLLAVALLAPGSTLWVDRTGGPGDRADFGLDVALSPDGARAFVTGWSMNASGDRDYLTVAYDVASGARLWSRRDADGFQAADVAVDPSGTTVLVTGTSATIAYDAATGVRRWRRMFAPQSPHDGGVVMALTPDRVIVSGELAGWARVVAYDLATGAQVWRQDIAGFLMPAGVDVSQDGSVAAAWQPVPGVTPRDYVTAVFDGSDGALRWTRTFDGPAGLADEASGMVVVDGLAIVTGASGSTGGIDRRTVAYALADGRQVWVRTYDGPAGDDETMASIARAPDGSSVAVTGRSRDASGRFDLATTVYEAATGAIRWTRRTGTDLPSLAYFPPSVAVTEDGSRVVVTGRTGDDRYITLAFDAASGTRSWTRRFARWGRNAPSAIAAGLDVVVVTGTSWSGAGSNFATVAYAT